MSAKIISSDKNEITIQVRIPLKKSMLNSEEAILKSTNEVGALATAEVLTRFDTDGTSIVVNNIKNTVRSKDEKEYQSPYGPIRVKRYVYQTSKGGKIYCPLENEARIICGATPKLAKTLSHKYSVICQKSNICASVCLSRNVQLSLAPSATPIASAFL